MKVISVRLDESSYSLLVDRAEETGIPPAVLARSWIRAELSNFREPLDPELMDELVEGGSKAPGARSRAERRRKAREKKK